MESFAMTRDTATNAASSRRGSRGRGQGAGQFAAVIHVGAQDGVDSRLPASSLPPISLDDIGVEAQRLIDLRARLARTAAPLSDGLRRFRAKDLADHGQRRPRPLEVLAGPLRVFVTGPRAPVDFFRRHNA
jgi:hypothetical protein